MQPKHPIFAISGAVAFGIGAIGLFDIIGLTSVTMGFGVLSMVVGCTMCCWCCNIAYDEDDWKLFEGSKTEIADRRRLEIYQRLGINADTHGDNLIKKLPMDNTKIKEKALSDIGPFVQSICAMSLLIYIVNALPMAIVRLQRL